MLGGGLFRSEALDGLMSVCGAVGGVEWVGGAEEGIGGGEEGGGGGGRAEAGRGGGPRWTEGGAEEKTEGWEEGAGTEDLGSGGGIADLRLKLFEREVEDASAASAAPDEEGDGDSVTCVFTRPPDALISLSKALNPAGRFGGTEEEDEEGGIDLRLSFSPLSSFFTPSIFSSVTRPPDALISLNKAPRPAGRFCGTEEAEAEDEEGVEGGIDLRLSFSPLYSSSCFTPSMLSPVTRPPEALISLSKAPRPAGRFGGTEDEGVEGGTDLRLSFSPLYSSSFFTPSIFSSVTRPPDALISLSKAPNPVGRLGGTDEAEEGVEGIGMADLGMGGGPTGFRTSLVSLDSLDSLDSSSLLGASTLDPFTRPPEALISLSKAPNPAGRFGGTEDEDDEEEGIADTGTGGGMDVPRTDSFTDDDGSGGGCFETTGEGRIGAMDDTTRLDSIDVLLHSPAEGRTR